MPIGEFPWTYARTGLNARYASMVAALLLAGCAVTPYTEPAEGPFAQLQVQVMAEGGWHQWVQVQTFDNSQDCSGIRSILKGTRGRDVRIKAESPTSLRLIHVTQSGWPITTMTSCQLIVTFDPKSNGRYRAEAKSVDGHCSLLIRDLVNDRLEPSARLRESVDTVSGAGKLCRDPR
jgi:hypothetical protein